jgi:hypothetical protein
MKIFQILFYTLLFMSNTWAMEEEIPEEAIIMDAMMFRDAENEGWSPEDKYNRSLWIEQKNRERCERSYPPYQRITPAHFPYSHVPTYVCREFESRISNNYDSVLPRKDPPLEKKNHVTGLKKPLLPGICANCSKTESTLWRVFKTPEDDLSVCNGCGIRAQKNKYCPYCYFIYYDADIDSNFWVRCKSCKKRAAHLECFQKSGNNKEVYKCHSCAKSHS